MKRVLSTVLPPLMLFVMVIAAWHFTVVGFEVKQFIVPKPSRVWNEAIERRGLD